MIPHRGEKGNRRAGSRPEVRAEHDACIRTYLLEIPVVALAAGWVAVIPDSEGEASATASNLLHHTCLLRVCSIAVYLSPVAYDSKRKSIGCPRGYLRPEAGRRIGAQEINRAKKRPV